MGAQITVPCKKFGVWATGYTKDTVYQAVTDGLVCVKHTQSATFLITGYTDSSTPPTTIRRYSQSYETGEDYEGLGLPVRKNDYWKITISAGTPTIYWLPLEP